ncbi:MAG TPA: dTDP-4-dehydrorhamnose reductase [Candidatus Anaerobiospirillum pullistercoris]|uniref:dTDP-4-dehydrorhamnose reductase n=1 Tax=Candidatus Anaerobiospirillum pullistercoris TaxID=2838452 RepID=A0A9D1WDZ5_9GAMM|nr:dTDP-4-dehydrorhamnose reductase [Candidatus Anaerobiospirillum pullistercoris]
MAKVFLTGAKGQVGSELELELLKEGYKVVSATHISLDIADTDRVLSAITAAEPQVVVNAAAFTNVERAEVDSSEAYSINAIGARNLAQACAQLHIPLIHISSDYVLDESSAGPHDENAKTLGEKSGCVYGRTKLEGEKLIQASGCDYIILRTSWVFGRFGRNFVKIMLSLAQERREIAVVEDQLGNPTPARPLAKAIVEMVKQVQHKDFKAYGIYHYCGEESTTWANFAREIFKLAKQMHVLPHEVEVVPINSRDFKSKAQRPHDSRLSCPKLYSVFHMSQPRWQKFLPEVITSYVRECQGLLPVEDYDNTITAFKEGTNIPEDKFLHPTAPKIDPEEVADIGAKVEL